jgi:hypothetical protein
MAAGWQILFGSSLRPGELGREKAFIDEISSEKRREERAILN